MRELPSTVEPIGAALAINAGGYLRNTVYAPGVTCVVCRTPIEGYARCFRCNTHATSAEPIADRVGTMVYALKHSPSVPRDQTYVAMYGYKAPTPQPAHSLLVRSLMALGVAGHWSCVTRLAGSSLTRWAVVPGTRHAAVEHPLHAMMASMFHDPSLEVPIRMRVGTTKTRALQNDHLEVVESIEPGTHVVVVDDSWVTGGSAQSVAMSLKLAGATDVSILAIARVLEPGWGPTSEFLKSSYARSDFDYTVCPWTGSGCP